MKLPWNWRSRIEIIKHYSPGREMIDFELTFRKGQTPKGFHRYIGDISVYNATPHFVGESEINEYFRKRGLGTHLYTYVLNDLGSLTTLYHNISKPAQAVWRTLVRQSHSHKVDFFVGTLTVSVGKIL